MEWTVLAMWNFLLSVINALMELPCIAIYPPAVYDRHGLQ